MIDSTPITPKQPVVKDSEIRTSLDVNDYGWYGLNLDDEFWLTTAEALGLYEYLSQHLSVLHTLEGNNFAKGGDLTQQTLEHPEAEEFIAVEWDTDFWGGDYFGSGETAHIPARDVGKYGIDRAFQRMTGQDPAHIISYNDESITRAEINEDADMVDMENPEEDQHGDE